MKYIIFLLIVLFATNVYANSLLVRFPCWEEKLIEEFEKAGIDLDKKDPFSDGWIENMGRSYKIHLFKRPQDYQPFVDIPLKVQKMYVEELRRKQCQQNTDN